MDVRKIFAVIVLAAIYGFLISVYLKLEGKHHEDSCPFLDECIRVCCASEEKCTKDVVKGAFNMTTSSHAYEEEEDPWDYLILHGKPFCPLYKSLQGNVSQMWRLDYRGAITVGEGDEKTKFSHDQYCIEDVNIEEGQWKLLTCEPYTFEMNFIKYSTLTISLLLFGATIFVYGYVEELRTFAHGKLLLMFAVFLFAFYLSSAIVDAASYMMFHQLNFCVMVAGVCSSFVWMFVMFFDVWYTLEKENSTSDDDKRFKSYLLGTFFALIFIMNIMFDGSMSIFVNLLNFVIFGTSIFIILAGLKIYKLSKDEEISKSIRFGEETARFRIYILLFVVMTLVWKLELRSWQTFGSHHAALDTIKCLTAGIIFTLLVILRVVKVNDSTNELTFDVNFGDLKA